MVFCSRCGQQNTDGAQYCLKCGQPMAVTQPSMEQRFKEFGEEVGKAGERLGREMGSRGKEFDNSFDRSFSFFGPLIKAVIAFIVLVIIGQTLNYLGDRYSLARSLSDFLIGSNHLAIFLLLFVFFSYMAFISRRKLEGYQYVQPFSTALAITFAIWVIFNLLDIIGLHYDIEFFSWSADVMWIILPLMFLLIILIGYSSLMSKEQARRSAQPVPPVNVPPASGQYYGPQQKSLYRSGKDRILGGVCAGLADYFNIDPTVMRIIWILLVVAGVGSFILVYLILWLIIPRDPSTPWP